MKLLQRAVNKKEDISELKVEWKLKLMQALTDDQADSLWDKIEDGVHR